MLQCVVMQNIPIDFLHLVLLWHTALCHIKCIWFLQWSLQCSALYNAAIWFLHLIPALTHWSGFFWCTHCGESLPCHWFLLGSAIIGELKRSKVFLFFFFFGFVSIEFCICIAVAIHCHCTDFYPARQLWECSKVRKNFNLNFCFKWISMNGTVSSNSHIL